MKDYSIDLSADPLPPLDVEIGDKISFENNTTDTDYTVTLDGSDLLDPETAGKSFKVKAGQAKNRKAGKKGDQDYTVTESTSLNGRTGKIRIN